MDSSIPYHIESDEEFTSWCESIPERIASLEHVVPSDLWNQMDLSPKSLVLLGEWLAASFESIDAIKTALSADALAALGAYVGEVHNRALGWRWHADTTDKNFMFYQRPVVTNGSGKCRSPVSSITAFAHSKRPAVLYGALLGILNRDAV